MTESSEDYELFHYGVKGMKWGVRRRSGYQTMPGGKVDFSKHTKTMDRANRRVDKAEDRLVKTEDAEFASRKNPRSARTGDRNLRKASVKAEKDFRSELKRADREIRKSAKETTRENRKIMDDAYLANGGQKRNAGKMYAEALLAPGGGMQVGMREAQKYGASRGQAATAAFLAGPYAGKLYRETKLRTSRRGSELKRGD